MSDFTNSFPSFLSWCNHTSYFACKNLSSEDARTASASSGQFYLPLCLSWCSDQFKRERWRDSVLVPWAYSLNFKCDHRKIGEEQSKETKRKRRGRASQCSFFFGREVLILKLGYWGGRRKIKLNGALKLWELLFLYSFFCYLSIYLIPGETIRLFLPFLYVNFHHMYVGLCATSMRRGQRKYYFKQNSK